jgi:Ni/Co efflux regulator RcnB
MKNLNIKIGGAILTLAFIFLISAAAGMTAQAQYRRDRDDRWSNNQSQNRDWRRERAERARLERARRDNANYGNNGNYGNYGNNGSYGNYGGYGNGSQVEANQGYQNGLSTGASDAQRRQSYSPQRSHFWKNASSQAFRSGFEQGYAQGYQQYAGYGNGGYGNTGNRSGSILGTILGNTGNGSGSILGTILGRP